jgi:hypothetical protein
LCDDLIIDEDDELTMKLGNMVNTSGFKGKGNIVDLNPSAIANGTPPIKEIPKGSLIQTKMLGCLNSRNEKNMSSLEPDLSTIHLHMCDQPELNRDKTKLSAMLDTNVTSLNPSAYLSGTAVLSSPKDRAALHGRNPEVQSFVLKTFDMAETTKHKDSTLKGGEFNTTEKKFLSSFAKGF